MPGASHACMHPLGRRSLGVHQSACSLNSLFAVALLPSFMRLCSVTDCTWPAVAGEEEPRARGRG